MSRYNARGDENPRPRPDDTISFVIHLLTPGKPVVVKGHIGSRDDLHVDGELENAVELQESLLSVGAET